jgi:mannose-6-phosphate isomerase-like protein (cupin superfamily)
LQENLSKSVSYVVREGDGQRFDVLGAHLVWKARGDDTDETFTVAVQTVGPTEGIPPHKHEYPEVFFVISGELIFTLTRGAEEFEETVKAGGTVIVAADAYHSVKNISGINATLLDIACFKHQQFFDAVAHNHASWEGLSPELTMQEVGKIAHMHTLEFRAAT